MPPQDDNRNELLIRLDERLKSIQSQFDSFALKILADIQSLKSDNKSDKENIDNKFVTKEEFLPVQKAVFAAVGLILSGIAAAIGSILIHGGGK